MESDVPIGEVTAVLPLCPFPPLHWWYLSQGNHGGFVCVDEQEQFVKQTARNRMQLCDSKGPFQLTFPVSKSQDQPIQISKVHLSSHRRAKALWKSIETAYASAPFFSHYEEELKTLWEQHLPKQGSNSCCLLIDWNWATIEWMAKACNWKIPDAPHNVPEFTPHARDLRDKQHLRGKGWTFHRYPQLFEDRSGFVGANSSLEALLILGPDELNTRLSLLTNID